MKRLTVVFILGLTVLFVTNTETVAATQEKGAKKCNDTLDNDGDGFVDGDDSDCRGVNIDDVARRVRVAFDGSYLAGDNQDFCAKTGFEGFQYWHSISDGLYDEPCDDNDPEPSQRVLSAMLACGFCFNTFGQRRPHDPMSQNDVQRWVTFKWGAELGIEEDIYHTDPGDNCDINLTNTVLCPPRAFSSNEDNLEISFDMSNPFVEPVPTVSNFEIEILAPRVRRNGRVAWEAKYTLVYELDLSITPDSSDAHLVRISTTDSGQAILTRLSNGTTSVVNMPFSMDARQVYGDGPGVCCVESPPGGP